MSSAVAMTEPETFMTPVDCDRLFSIFEHTWRWQLPRRVRVGLERFFVNSLPFEYALPLMEGGGHRIANNEFSNFTYDHKSGLVFFDSASGMHHLLAAYLEAARHPILEAHEGATLHWIPEDCLTEGRADRNAQYKLAEVYVSSGNGLLCSSASTMNSIHVGRNFRFSALERRVFANFARQQL